VISLSDIFFDQIRDALFDKLDLTRELSNNELYELIDNDIMEASKSNYIPLTTRTTLRKKLFNSIRGLDILEDFLEDNSITEIMINSYDKIFIERDGRLYKTDAAFLSSQKLLDVIQQMVSYSNRRINQSNPITDTRLYNGSRVNIVLDPISLDGPVVTIRRFPDVSLQMEDLIKSNSITKEAAEFLRTLVISGYNIFISGGTGSGKTTFLNLLSAYIPSDERVITIEDSAELQIKHLENLIRLEVRQKNSEGLNEISIRDLIKTSLRMRPNRIIIGEVRGFEALDMLQAMNTGHDGSLSTGHSNSPKDMLFRLETMVLMGANMNLISIRNQISSAIDIIVHLGRLRDKSRHVLDITEVLPCKDGEYIINPLYRFIEDEESDGDKVLGSLTWLKNPLIERRKLYSMGIKEINYE